MGSLQNIAMKETQMIVQAHPQNSLFQLPFIHVVAIDIKVHEIKMLVPVIFHTIPDYNLEGMQPSISQPLARNNMVGRRILIPPQTNLDFLIQHR
jgi:hypothetical protein